MQPTDPTEKGYTDEQWESLLSQTFGCTPTVAPTVSPPPPEPELADETVSTPAAPIPNRKWKPHKKHWIIAAVSLVLLVIALCIFLFSPSAPDKEQKQCIEALRQWQSMPYYQMDTYTYHHTSSKGPFTDSGNDSYIYGPPVESSVSNRISVYYQGDNCKLTLSHIITGGDRKNEGQAQYGDNWCTYSNVSINFYLWKLTDDRTPIPLPWVQSFSFDNVQILSQQVLKTEGNNKTVTFAVMDTDPAAELYEQGPYHVQFLFNEDGWLYGVMRYQSDTQNKKSTITASYIKEMSAELVERKVTSQIYTAFSGLIEGSLTQPIIQTVPPA